MKTLILFLFASGFRVTTGKVAVVQTCPKTKTAWDHRSSIFTCEDGNNKYHCVMTSVLNLVEVCITPLNITGNEKGCPFVYIFESAAYWEFPFTSCPVQNTECPQDGHGGYTSEQLYKYPSCFRNISERISGDNNFTQTTTGTRVSTSTCNIFQEEARTSNMEYLPYTTVVMFLLLCSLHVFILLTYWTNRRHVKQVEARIEECSKRISQVSSLSIGTLPVMIGEGSKNTSQISISSNGSLSDLKESDRIPLSYSYTRPRTRYTPQNCYVPSLSMKDVKVNGDSRKGTSTTANYESPVEKDMKGKDVTPLPDSDTTNYANCPVGKDDDPPVPVSDARKDTSSTSNYKSPVQKDVKVNDDPSLPVSDSRKGTSSRAIYERPVQKDCRENRTVIILPPVGKGIEEK